jgi:hypothetical protein
MVSGFPSDLPNALLIHPMCRPNEFILIHPYHPFSLVAPWWSISTELTRAVSRVGHFCSITPVSGGSLLRYQNHFLHIAPPAVTLALRRFTEKTRLTPPRTNERVRQWLQNT